MKFEIQVRDHLSEEEIRNIVQDEVRIAVRRDLSKESDLQRFLSNAAYRFVARAIQEQTPDNIIDIIASKVPEIVNGLTAHDIFKPRDAWEREESNGWRLMQNALTESEPLIRNRVRALISNIDLYMIRNTLTEMIDNAIMNTCKPSMPNAGREEM